MRFTPKTADEIALDGLLSPGTYPFEVIKAEETQSKKSGADMMKLQLKVFGPGTREVTIFDYLMESVADRLFKFCLNVGLEDKYHSGKLEAHDCEGKSGWVNIKIQPAQNGYEPKNVVSYYCQEPKREERETPPLEPKPSAKRPPLGNLDTDDEIPF